MLVRIAEDGSFETLEQTTHTPFPGAEVSIPHPIVMRGTQAAWAKRFDEYRIVPLLEQLTRPVFRLTPAELEGTALPMYHGRTLDPDVLRSGDLTWSGSSTYFRWERFIIETDTHDRITSVSAFFRKPLVLSALRPQEISEVCLALDRATH